MLEPQVPKRVDLDRLLVDESVELLRLVQASQIDKRAPGAFWQRDLCAKDP